jgi:hypothetical protein
VPKAWLPDQDQIQACVDLAFVSPESFTQQPLRAIALRG